MANESLGYLHCKNYRFPTKNAIWASCTLQKQWPSDHFLALSILNTQAQPFGQVCKRWRWCTFAQSSCKFISFVVWPIYGDVHVHVHVGHITNLHTLRPLPQIWLISYQHGWIIFALANSQNCLHRGMQDMKILPNGFPGCVETLPPRTRIINTTRWQEKGKHITRTIINSNQSVL